MKTQPVHVPQATHATVKRYARVHGLDLGDAVAQLVAYALSRKAALARHKKKAKH